LKLLPFAEFNTMALAILTEQRDLVGASYGCETAKGDQD
jgi:hypothetical protein